MSTSYRKINYSIRPAKCIERKMLSHSFRRLSTFSKLSEYRYVGFGSTFFSDFALFHKNLGIHKMISIEENVGDQLRFMFNCPYSCIEMKFAHSNEVLPTLEWEEPTILWLDYDGKLDESVFEDIQTFCQNAVSGSMIIISVNAHPAELPKEISNIAEFRYEELVSRINEGRIPVGIKGKNLSKKNIPFVYREIINNGILDFINKKNGGLSSNEELNYSQLFNFMYEDGVQMLTIGGLIYANKDNVKYEQANFLETEFIRQNEDIFNIDVPSLTIKEINLLNSFLPSKINFETGRSRGRTLRFLPPGDVKKFASIYRYFPTFAETNF